MKIEKNYIHIYRIYFFVHTNVTSYHDILFALPGLNPIISEPLSIVIKMSFATDLTTLFLKLGFCYLNEEIFSRIRMHRVLRSRKTSGLF